MAIRVAAATKGSAQAGSTLIEVLIASSLLLITSAFLASTMGSIAVASRGADQAVSVQIALDNVRTLVDDTQFVDLLALNGSSFARAGVTVGLTANLAAVGLVVIELTAVDDATGAIVARSATYRSGEL